MLHRGYTGVAPGGYKTEANPGLHPGYTNITPKSQTGYNAVAPGDTKVTPKYTNATPRLHPGNIRATSGLHLMFARVTPWLHLPIYTRV